MMNAWFTHYRNGLLAAMIIAVYLKFFILPTADLFFSAYHLSKLEALYVGYQVFKVAGYLMSTWDYQNIAAIAVGALVFLCYLFFKRRSVHALKSRD